MLLALINVSKLYAQVKKPVVKKAVVTAKLKAPVKTNTAAVVKPKLSVQNKTIDIKKVKAIKISAVANKAVNNSEITNVSLTNREKEMINEINSLRSNPARYCTYVENYLQKNDVDDEIKIAAKELIGVLKKLEPLPPLTLNLLMYNDARQYGLLMAKRNIFEHSSLPYAENLSLGYKDIRDAIVDLLIDEGIPDRGHRKILLNEKIKHVAVFELPGKVQDIAYCYVQEFK